MTWANNWPECKYCGGDMPCTCRYETEDKKEVATSPAIQDDEFDIGLSCVGMLVAVFVAYCGYHFTTVLWSATDQISMTTGQWMVFCIMAAISIGMLLLGAAAIASLAYFMYSRLRAMRARRNHSPHPIRHSR